MNNLTQTLKTAGLIVAASVTWLGASASTAAADPVLLSEITVVASALELKDSRVASDSESKENALRLIREQIQRDLDAHIAIAREKLIVRTTPELKRGRS